MQYAEGPVLTSFRLVRDGELLADSCVLAPNAGCQLLPEAEARDERTLKAVSWTPLLGAARLWRHAPWAPWLRSRAPTDSPVA